MFEISYSVLLIVLFLLGLVFLFIPVKKDSSLRNYMISLRLIAFSYIALGAYCYFKARYPQQLFSVPFLAMSSLQAILLGASHINLINPRRVTRKFLLNCFIPLIVFAVLYIVVRIFYPHVELDSYELLAEQWKTPEVLVRLIWMAGYVLGVLFFAITFFREDILYQRRALNWFSDSPHLDLKIVRASFVMALSVATVTVAITCCLSPDVAAWLNFAILVLYIAMGLLFIRYPAIFFEISPLLFDDKPKLEQTEEGQWKEFKDTIIEHKLFIRQGITLDELARLLGTNRNKLSSMINKCEGENFNSFINGLRISEAISILEESPSVTFADIAESVGYSEPSNFSRQFRKVTGISPQQYRIALNNNPE